MKPIRSQRSALKPCDNQSLFKFYLTFHERTPEYAQKRGRDWTWYSFDMPDERERFPNGLSQQMRMVWTPLLKAFKRYDDLYLFIRECYPIWDGDLFCLYMPKQITGHLPAISTKYNEVVAGIMEQHDIHNYRLMQKEQYRTIPGQCPSKNLKINSEDYYGINYFRHNKKISEWFSTKALKVVKIYDNRCYHDDNLIGLLDQSHYPEPATIPVITHQYKPEPVVADFQAPSAIRERRGPMSLSTLIPSAI